MMIRHRGFSFEAPFEKEIFRLQSMSRHLEATVPTVLKAVGFQAASWAVRDFRAKSDRETVGGIQWKEIGDRAIWTRVRGRPKWKKQKAELDQLRVKYDSAKNDKERKRISKRRDTIRKQRLREFQKERSGYRIGVDTGRLVNSLTYGVSELSSIKPPRLQTWADAPERALFDISDKGITIGIRLGSRMRYAEYYDELRPIFSPQFIDEDRRKVIDKLIEKTVDAYFKKVFGGGR